jgi:hypothetical protein
MVHWCKITVQKYYVYSEIKALLSSNLTTESGLQERKM